jgi:hypothetical protein
LARLALEVVSDFAELAQPAAQVHVKLSEIERKLLQLKGGGIAVRRMDSTLLLLRETREIAEQQRARLASLHTGALEILGS